MENKGSGLEGIIQAYDEVLSHYDFVINDLCSDIYDPALQAKKAPVISFLKDMRSKWETCRADAQKQLERLR